MAFVIILSLLLLCCLGVCCFLAQRHLVGTLQEIGWN